MANKPLRIAWNNGLTKDDPRVRKNIEACTKTLKERHFGNNN